MKRRIGLKRSFNYEDLASIVQSAGASIDDQYEDGVSRNHIHARRHKRIRTESLDASTSSSIRSQEEATKSSNRRLISPVTSQDRVTVITPDSSPSIPSMTDTAACSCSLSDCPATAALNHSLIESQRSSITDWAPAFFPLDGGHKGQHVDKRPTDRHPSLEFPPRRSLTSRSCSLRKQQRQDHYLEVDAQVSKLQTAFSLLSLPRRV